MSEKTTTMKKLGLWFPYLVFGVIAAAVIADNRSARDGGQVPSTICRPCGMAVDPKTALTERIDGRTFYFCSPNCRDAMRADGGNKADAVVSERLVDVVCNMEVNASWGITANHAGKTLYFCTDKCRREFERDPQAWLAPKCVVCKGAIPDPAAFPATYLGRTYPLCTEAHRAQFKQDPAAYFMHSMWGIPSWLYYASIAIILVLSFGLFEWLGRRASPAASREGGKQREGKHIASERIRCGASTVRHAAGARILSRTHSRGNPFPRPAGARILSRTHSRGNPFPRPPAAHGPQDGNPAESRDEIGISSQRACVACPSADATATAAAVPKAQESLLAPADARSPLLRKSVLAPTDARSPLVRESLLAPADTRVDLLSLSWVRRALMSRVFRFALQAVFVAMFLLIIAAGLFGNQNPALNIAPILTWTIWWCVLIMLIMVAGKSWCYVCPWDAIAAWTEKLAFWKKRDDGLSLNLKWPRVLRNVLLATVLFVGLTWIEIGFGVTMKPRVTAYLAIAMLLMAVACAMVFEKKSFCRYACLVGRVSGLYALFAGTEVRRRSEAVCTSCRTKECIRGSEMAYGCPTFLYPGKLKTNTYCIQCMECLQACPHDNMTVNLRPWGADLAVEGKPRSDEAYLALLMLAITGFHGLTMTPVWQQLVNGIRGATGAGRIVGFSVGMTLLMVGPIIVYALLVGLSKRLGDAVAPRRLQYHDYFVRYAYALLPIALFYHIAHNSEHLLMEGPKVLAMVSDPFGWGWNVLGTADWTIPPLISLQQLWLVQVLLVLIGHLYGLWVAQKTSTRLFGSYRAAFRSQLPMLFGMICFSVFSLWLLKQPMEMRTSAM